MTGGDAAPGLPAEPVQELAGKRAEIDIGAVVHLRGGDGLVPAALDQQRRPTRDGCRVIRERHPLEKMVRGHPRISVFEEVHHLPPVDEAQVRHRVDEVLRAAGHAVRNRVAPELLGLLELLEYLDDLAHVHRAVRLAPGRVAQLADAGVARARVVPAVGAFLRQAVGGLVDLEGKRRLQPLEHRAEVRGHDPAADQDDVRIFDVGGVSRGHVREAAGVYLRKASCRPPSTVMTWPVVLLRRLLTSRKYASAWSAGVIGDLVSVRSA